MNSTPNGFWAGGGKSYLDALWEQEAELLQPLLDSLHGESDPERRQSLEGQIKAIRTEFKDKRKAAASGLFMKP